MQSSAPLRAAGWVKRLTIHVEPPLSPDARALLAESTADLGRALPADEIFTLAPEDLVAPNITFFVARLENQVVGCVALVDMTTYGEVKRLFVRDTFRNQGVAQALMAVAEQFCRDVGLLEVKLESSPALHGAHKLYEATGYRTCAPFGDYPVLDSSLFMAKDLAKDLGRVICA